MSNVKLLNLDELAAHTRAVNIKGTEYPVAEQTVGQMIHRLQMAKTKQEDLKDPEVFLANMRQTAQDILPTAPKKVIEGLTLKQITALIEFINDRELDQAADEVKAEQQAKGKAETPAKK